MGSLEGEIGNAGFERVAEASAVRPQPLMRRLEDFAVGNVRSLAAGASAGIVLLAAALTTGGGQQVAAPQSDSLVTVGSVTPVRAGEGQVRVPSLPEWQAVRKPVEMITLAAPQFDRAGPQYGARRTSRNDREDSLTWQPPAPGGAEARVALVRMASPGAAPSLFVDMTRQQAERGIAVTRAGAPGKVETKFGPIEMADMTFSDASGGTQACLAFRTMVDGEAPVVSGWYCAAQGAAVERPEVACFLDRLTLLKSGDDQALRRFFTEAEQRRKPCPTTRVSTGRKPTWLDQDGRAPAMRGAEETTGSIGKPKR